MAARRGWAVLMRDFAPIEGDDADVVSVLKVFLDDAQARAEVLRLRTVDPSDDKLFYCEETEVETD
jgi:hypothetical protein